MMCVWARARHADASRIGAPIFVGAGITDAIARRVPRRDKTSAPALEANHITTRANRQIAGRRHRQIPQRQIAVQRPQAPYVPSKRKRNQSYGPIVNALDAIKMAAQIR